MADSRKEPTPAEVDAAVMRSNEAMARGDLETAMDALAEIGFVVVTTGPDGVKRVHMPDDVAAVVRKLMEAEDAE